MQSVYIIGAKGISFYGGFESFLQKLLEYHKNQKEIKYYVTCKANGDGSMDVSKLNGASEVIDGRFTYCNADCFMIDVPEWMGSAQAVVYDVKALKACCKHIEQNHVENAVVYILACRIGPFIQKYVKRLHKLGAKIYLNPDGHEWKRAKWSGVVRRYWKESERLMVKYADLVICDSVNIESYIQNNYKKYDPKTTFIAYGAETKQNGMADDDPKYVDWLKKHGLVDRMFYISVGRFVPENNFEIMIREFMKSKTEKDFAIITTDNSKLLNELENKLHYRQDKRIKFVGTVYDQELLTKIRENAYGYFHGHSVGGTNPSLLEALGSTELNLLFDIGFNREVAEDTALYWSKSKGDLAALIERADQMTLGERTALGEKAKHRIMDAYSWELITEKYKDVFRS